MENQKALEELSKLIDENIKLPSSSWEESIYADEEDEFLIGIDGNSLTEGEVDALLDSNEHIVSIDWDGDIMIIDCGSEEYAEEIYSAIESIMEDRI